MGVVFIPFDSWSPSSGYFGEGWNTAQNIYPAFGAWRPWHLMTPYPQVTGFGAIHGAHAHPWSSGVGSTSYIPNSTTIFAGARTRQLVVNQGTGAFTDVSRAANYAAVGEPAYWRYASVGNDIWATNHLDAWQRRVNNAGLFTDGVASTFKPVPRFLATVREHMVGANLANAGRRQDEVVWSDADDATNYDPPTATSTSLAGSKPLPSIPGQITGLTGGQYALVFKQTGIFYLEYTGTSQVFRPDVLSPNVGTRWPSSIINSRSGVYFLGGDGMYRIVGLAEPVKISTPGVDQILMDSGFTSSAPDFSSGAFSYTEADEDSQMLGFDHPMMPLVGWLYRTELSQEGNDRILLYNYALDRWALATGLPTTTVLTRANASLYNTLTGFTASSGVYSFAVTSTTIAAPTLVTNYRPANWEDAPNAFQQTMIRGVLPVFSKKAPDNSPLTHSVTVTPLLDANGSPGTAETAPYTTRNPATGFYPFQTASRWFRISIACAAEDFGDFSGVWVDQELLK